jgi:formylglycine-generating enzyme required for sulfatase activity
MGLAPSGGIVMNPKVFTIGARPASLPSMAIRLSVDSVERDSLDPRRSDLIASTDLWMVQIPAGTFMMGSPEDKTPRRDNEVQHSVTLTKAFWLGQTPVTQAQWQAVMGTNPSWFKSQSTGDDDGWSRPVEQVTWYDAIEFCNRLTAIVNRRDARLGLTPCYRISKIEREEGGGQIGIGPIVSAEVELIAGANGYRLPTEAEWEYACRAGTMTAYSFGDDDRMLAKHAWFRENSGFGTHPVATKRSNAWGLFDMHGNVEEWCWDRYGENPRGAVTDPQGQRRSSRRFSARVLRGGGWNGVSQCCRAADRIPDDPDSRGRNFGFRVARTP